MLETIAVHAQAPPISIHAHLRESAKSSAATSAVTPDLTSLATRDGICCATPGGLSGRSAASSGIESKMEGQAAAPAAWGSAVSCPSPSVPSATFSSSASRANSLGGGEAHRPS